jgi:hypothetical protein
MSLNQEGVKRRVVKSFLSSSLLNPATHAGIIEEYVKDVHTLTQTEYLLAQYTFIHEVSQDGDGLQSEPLKAEIFTECLLAANEPQIVSNIAPGQGRPDRFQRGT